jgi:hypothetical protein
MVCINAEEADAGLSIMFGRLLDLKASNIGLYTSSCRLCISNVASNTGLHFPVNFKYAEFDNKPS